MKLTLDNEVNFIALVMHKISCCYLFYYDINYLFKYCVDGLLS